MISSCHNSCHENLSHHFWTKWILWYSEVFCQRIKHCLNFNIRFQPKIEVFKFSLILLKAPFTAKIVFHVYNLFRCTMFKVFNGYDFCNIGRWPTHLIHNKLSYWCLQHRCIDKRFCANGSKEKFKSWYITIDVYLLINHQ